MLIGVSVALLLVGCIAAFVTFKLLKVRLNWKTDVATAVAAAVLTLFGGFAAGAFQVALQAQSTPQADGLSGKNPPALDAARAASTEAGWGPGRVLYTNNSPAAIPVLNSLTDNPNAGDERNFAVLKNMSTGTSAQWLTSANVEVGQRYLFRIYVNNAAADNLDSATLRDVKLRFELPRTIGGDPTRRSAGVSRYCALASASNAVPPKVWNCGVLTATEGVQLLPDLASIKLYNNVFGPAGLPLGTGILTAEGQTVGFDRMDGAIKAGYRYAAYVAVEVQVERL